MGFEEDCFKESVDDMIDLALQSGNPRMDGITREKLEEGPTRLNLAAVESVSTHPKLATNVHELGKRDFFLPFAEGNFRTTSGKAELYSEGLRILGLDPVANFSAPFRVASRRARTSLSARNAGTQGR